MFSKKSRRSSLLALAALSSLGVLGASHAHAATILNFTDGTTTIGDDTLVPQNYGDNVSAPTTNGYAYGNTVGSPVASDWTPNVTAAYGTGGGGQGLKVYGKNDLLYGAGGAAMYSTNLDPFTMTLTAAATFKVTLEGLDIVGSSDNLTLIVKVDGVTVFSPSAYTSAQTLTFGGATYTSAAGGNIQVIEQNTAGGGIALDNIIISQPSAIPEPASLSLLALGGLGLLRRQRRA